jgi:peptidoglycan/xylan/chitin deacetylase (PgdA/CDA1 family)
MPSLITRRELLRLMPAAALAAGGMALDLVNPAITEAVALSNVSGVVSSADGWLNLRSGPGSQYRIVRSLPNGTSFAATATSGDWFRINALGQIGWVNSWYTTLTGQRSVAYTRGNTGRKQVALTFDCGSDLGYTDQILDIIGSHGVPASFGLCGDWLSSFPDHARSVVESGHQLINHTLNHRSFTGLSTPGTGSRSPAKRLSQIQANETLIRQMTGARAKPYWRPPFGDYDASVLRDAGALGYTRTAMWTIDSLGWNKLTADEIYSRLMKRVAWGAIVLMHVGAESQDANALDRLIRQLKALGYSFGTFAQVIA